MTAPASSSHTPRVASLALFLYGALGFVTLTHEVAWTRQLIGMVGSAMGGVSIMLSVFMAGLALGSLLGGRLAERTGQPTRSLATFLVLTGATSLLAIPVDTVASVVQVGERFPALGPHGAAIVSLLATVPIMMLPALFAGAAFPVVALLASADGNLTSAIGRTLAWQTGGSVVGAVAAGFAMLPLLGVDATFIVGSVVAIGAGLLLAGVTASEIARPERPTQSQEPPGVTELVRAARAALVLSGAATLVYEVAWTRELLLVFGSSVYATAVMLAAVLLGLGAGQWLGSKQLASVPSGVGKLSRILFAAAVFGGLSVVVIRLTPVLYAYAFTSLGGSLAAFGLVQLLLSALVVVVPATLIGMASPLMIRFAVASSPDRSRKMGTAYALNTLGSVAGSLVAGFVLLPALTAKWTIGVAMILQIAAAASLAVVAMRRHGARQPIPAVGYAMLVAAFAAIISVNAASPLLNLTMTRPAGSASEFVATMRQAEPVYFKDAAQGRVAVYRLPNDNYVLRGAGMTEGALGLIDAQTTELLVRLPSQVAAHARRYFVIGLGTGSTTFTALQIPGVESVDTVELNPSVIPASRYFVQDLLDKDPRSRIHVSDARVYLASVETTYDVIVSEPSYPLSPYSAQLFTREFFELEKARLAPGGVAVQWLPAYLLQSEDAAMMIKTFATVFPETHVWATHAGNDRTVDLILIGTNGTSAVEASAVAAAIKGSGGESFNFTYELGPENVKAFTDDASIPLNTDDKPLLEYRTPLRQIAALWK